MRDWDVLISGQGVAIFVIANGDGILHFDDADIRQSVNGHHEIIKGIVVRNGDWPDHSGFMSLKRRH